MSTPPTKPTLTVLSPGAKLASPPDACEPETYSYLEMNLRQLAQRWCDQFSLREYQSTSFEIPAADGHRYSLAYYEHTSSGDMGGTHERLVFCVDGKEAVGALAKQLVESGALPRLRSWIDEATMPKRKKGIEHDKADQALSDLLKAQMETKD